MICELCKKEFKGRNRKGRIGGKSRFCSRECSDINRRKPNLCKTCGKDFKRTSHARRYYCSLNCQKDGEWYQKMKELHVGEPSWNKGKPNTWSNGEKSNFWIDGRTPENKKIRGSLEYKIWREAVFARDDWTCVKCGKHGGDLEADHIKPFALYPELRLAIDNGRTLCKPCHRQTDTYGGYKMYRKEIKITQN